MENPQWRNVGISGNSGTQAMALAGNLFNQAIENAQGGLTKHEEDLAMNAEAERAANTALVLKMKGEGKQVSDDFLSQIGMYNGKEINDRTLELDMFAEQKRKAQVAESLASANLAAKSNEPSWLQKEQLKIDLKLEQERRMKEGQFGSAYNKKSAAGTGSEAGKLMKEIGLTVETKNDAGETVYGNIDEDNNIVYQAAINRAIAKGATKNQIRNALSRNTSTNNWTSNFTPQDEKGLNVDGFLTDLKAH